MTSMSDRLDQEPPQPWKPSAAGEQIIGVVTALDEREGEYGVYPVVVVVDDRGILWAVRGQHEALRNQLARCRPEVGDRIGVRFLGQRESARGRGYFDYRCEVDKAVPDAPFDWDRHTSLDDNDRAVADDDEPF